MLEIKAMIIVISSVFLRDEEKAFIIKHKPWAFIFIDQEGGRVQRFFPTLVSHYPAAATLEKTL